MTVTREWLVAIPKAELHVHLDGCVRPHTMLELGRRARVALPADSPNALAQAMLVRHAHNLEDYLDRYRYTVAVMQTRDALQRIAREFVIDVAAEGVRYVEVRFCPALHTNTMSPQDALEAALDGLVEGERESRCLARLIVSALRTMPPSVSEDLAHLAVEYRERGVVAFDLAGAEAGHPAVLHASAFQYARRHDLACTCHAGEADGPASVWQAIRDCGAVRIGHGTRIAEDAALEAYVIEHGIPLEICLSSNVHTRAVATIEDHPLRRYVERGVVVTLNTDGRLMDGVSLIDEYALAARVFGFDREQLLHLVMNGFTTAFLPPKERDAMVADMQRELGPR